jgi:uncharacterized membrane protein (Fun14 family)
VLGLAFVALQGLAYAGIVTVNWTKVGQATAGVLDRTGDGWVGARAGMLGWWGPLLLGPGAGQLLGVVNP